MLFFTVLVLPALSAVAAGSRLRAHCTSSRGTLCVPCGAGLYTGFWNYIPHCLLCDSCSDHQRVVRPCNGFVNTVCECEPGFYWDQHFCKRHNVCKPGHGVKAAARKFLEELEFSMAHKQRIRSYVLLCACLLALPSGRDALTCCRRDFSNGSTSCQLSNAPDPTCDTEWIADGVTVVDETGETDPTRVQHAEPQTLVLKERHTEIIFQMDCAATKNHVKLPCNDLCPSSDDLTTATAESQRTNNAGSEH